MNIETTVNISNINRELLKKKAKSMSIPINTLVIKLFIYYMDTNLGKYKTFSQIKYQKKKNNEFWKTLHISLSPDLYEKCQDLRKFHKLSISHILSLAIKLYLKRIKMKTTDNYRKNYIFINQNFEECPIFIIMWKVPKKNILEKQLKLYEYT